MALYSLRSVRNAAFGCCKLKLLLEASTSSNYHGYLVPSHALKVLYLGWGAGAIVKLSNEIYVE
jgi:hypothetical protein